MKIIDRARFSFLWRLLLFCLFAAGSLFAQNTVIRAGHLFDSRTGQIPDNQAIIVKDRKIWIPMAQKPK